MTRPPSTLFGLCAICRETDLIDGDHHCATCDAMLRHWREMDLPTRRSALLALRFAVISLDD